VTDQRIADVDSLFAVLAASTDRTDAENVSLLAHGLQCAAVLAETAPDDPALHVAGLVHDVGTALWPDRPRTHARAGAAVVASLLGKRVAWLVGHHDQAKRYLVTVDPAYHSRLSPGSVRTLEAQGGLLDGDERARLETEPWLDDVLALRRADDDAKVPGRTVPDLEHWRPVVERVSSIQAAWRGFS
jgi:predicted HD phosphohydrolase